MLEQSCPVKTNFGTWVCRGKNGQIEFWYMYACSDKGETKFGFDIYLRQYMIKKDKIWYKGRS